MAQTVFVTADDLALGGVETDPYPWMADGLCRDDDPAVWFPGMGESHVAAAAVAICSTCPVRVECLAYAIEHDVGFGVFGGTSATERGRRSEEELLAVAAVQVIDAAEERPDQLLEDEVEEPEQTAPVLEGHAASCPTGYHEEPARGCYAHGCTCDGCRAANAAYVTERRAARRVQAAQQAAAAA